MEHLVRPKHGCSVVLDVTPKSAAWEYLSFRVVVLDAGQIHTLQTASTEVALVPLVGKGGLTVGDERFEVARDGVFRDKPHILYVAPGREVTVEAISDFESAAGGAPAEGKYPLRLFTPDQMKVDVRGGGASRRQVNHVLAHPLPAERLILYEVYVPSGAWSGWPPHCHDRYQGSPYLEETYYFRLDPEYSFGMHRNYCVDTDFDEVFPVRHGDLMLVTQGFHSTVPAPNCNMYFLCYLAGELLDDARATPPFDDPNFAWIKSDWEANAIQLPVAGGDLPP